MFAQFAVGWWLMIDAAVVSHVPGTYHLIGVASTVALLMYGAVP